MKHINKLGIFLGCIGLSILTLSILLFSKQESYNFDNGHVRFYVDPCLTLTEDYSYGFTTSLIFSLVDNQNPSGILTLQVYSDKSEIDAKSALELFEEDETSFEASGFQEITTSDTAGGQWDLISGGDPMKQLYLVRETDECTIVLRVLTTPELFDKFERYFLNLPVSIDVYGLGVLTPGEQIHEYFEKNS